MGMYDGAHRNADAYGPDNFASGVRKSFADSDADACLDRDLTPYALADPIAFRYAGTINHAGAFQYADAIANHSSVANPRV